MKNCFKKINKEFKRSIYLEKNITKEEFDSFDRSKAIYFLMGGNPLTQRKIIDRLNLNEELINYDGLVIGFCAGAIKLSKYSIITTDDDFPTPSSYIGLGRVNITMEPHYNQAETKENLERRHKEIKQFCKKYNTEILAVPDTSIIIIEDEKLTEKGTIYKFKAK